MDISASFPPIDFDPLEHRYFVNGEEYASISSILDDFTSPFEREAVAEKVAKRDGITPEEVKLTWDIRRDYAIVRGTEFHLYVETYLNEQRKIDLNTSIEHEIEQFHQFWDERNEGKFKVLATELKICDLGWKTAGTVDCLVTNQEDGKIYLIDWKTNREIKTKNQYQKFLSPIEHLEDCDFNKYSLQTSFYRMILEKNTSLKISGMYLLHFPKEEKYRVIACKDLSREIKTLLELKKTNR